MANQPTPPNVPCPETGGLVKGFLTIGISMVSLISGGMAQDLLFPSSPPARCGGILCGAGQLGWTRATGACEAGAHVFRCWVCFFLGLYTYITSSQRFFFELIILKNRSQMLILFFFQFFRMISWDISKTSFVNSRLSSSNFHLLTWP